MTAGLYDEDSSMQGYGRRLGKFGPAVDETHKGGQTASEQAAALASAYKAAAQQVDSDLPGSKRLAAEMEAQAKLAEAARLDFEAGAEKLRRLGADAAGLPGLYRAEHETDEDRLNAPRNSREAEKRADVGRAEQDT